MAPNTEPPTLGEVLRRLDGVSRQLEALTTELKNDRKEAAELYVRRDVYMEAHKADAAVVADLHGDIQALKADHGNKIAELRKDRQLAADKARQMWLAIAAMAVTIVLGVTTIIVNVTSR